MMRRAMKGRLDLFTAVQSIEGELSNYAFSSVDLPDTPLALQEHMIKMSKKIALMIAGAAAQKFMQNLVKEQETLEKLADMIIQVFAMESGLLRTLKIIAEKGEGKAKHQIEAVKVYVDENIPVIETWAKQVLAYAEEGDMLKTQLAGVKKLARYQPIDAVSLKREIADRIVEIESYLF